MSKLIPRRPSPAMALAFVALLAALSGTAIALPGTNSVQSNDIKRNAVTSPKIKRNAVRSSDIKRNAVRSSDIKRGAVRSSDVKNDSLTGSDINESTLGKVPSAGTADQAGAANVAGAAGSVSTLVPFGPVSANEGASATLATRGPLSVVGTCDANGTDTDAFVELRSTVAALGAGDDDDGAIAPGTPLVIEDAGASDSPTGGASTSDGYDDQFFATVAGSSAISGTVNSTANADSSSCTFSGFVVVVK